MGWIFTVCCAVAVGAIVGYCADEIRYGHKHDNT